MVLKASLVAFICLAVAAFCKAVAKAGGRHDGKRERGAPEPSGDATERTER